MTIKKQATNYSPAQEALLRSAAEENGGKLNKHSVNALLTNPLFKDKTDRMLRAKAANMGIYQAQKRQSVNGGDVKRKADLVSEIEKVVGFSVDTFEAASKVQLEKILEYVTAKAA